MSQITDIKDHIADLANEFSKEDDPLKATHAGDLCLIVQGRGRFYSLTFSEIGDLEALLNHDAGAGAHALREIYDDGADSTGEHPHFTAGKWQEAVRAGHTRQGYWDWLEEKIESAAQL